MYTKIYIRLFQLVLRCCLVAREENLTGVSTSLTGRSKNLDPTGNPTIGVAGGESQGARPPPNQNTTNNKNL